MFQSTPARERVTTSIAEMDGLVDVSIHTRPRAGDATFVPQELQYVVFQSTPARERVTAIGAEDGRWSFRFNPHPPASG